MKFLMVGAGALGGYFGGRMLEAGLDVTFLVRERRAAQLAADGLVIKSVVGDLTVPAPPTVTHDRLDTHFDVIVVSCKAYDLESTMADFARAVGPDTTIIPLLNGMAHVEKLVARFGDAAVTGGLCIISAALDAEGTVRHFNDSAVLMYGERAGGRSPRIDAIEAEWKRVNMDGRCMSDITQSMWEKWCAICSIAGITCLMRSAIGDVVAAGAAEVGLAIFAECSAVAAAYGHEPVGEQKQRAINVLQVPGSLITASMLKDIERGARTEGDHILGNMLALGRARGVATPTLRIAAGHLAAYEQRRAREQA